MSGRTRMRSPFGVGASASATGADVLRERLAFSERRLAALRTDSRASAERIAGLCRLLGTRRSETALAWLERDGAHRERNAAVAFLALAMADLREARAKADALGGRVRSASAEAGGPCEREQCADAQAEYEGGDRKPVRGGRRLLPGLSVQEQFPAGEPGEEGRCQTRPRRAWPASLSQGGRRDGAA